jgi:hypothetical protein
MKQFKIRENGFKEIRKQTIMRTIPITLMAMLVGLAIFEFNPNNNSTSDINVYPFIIPIIIGALAFGLIKGIKRQKAIYDKYMLTIDDSGITREQGNTPAIRLLFSDITKIAKNNQGGFVITGRSLANSIIVLVWCQASSIRGCFQRSDGWMARKAIFSFVAEAVRPIFHG